MNKIQKMNGERKKNAADEVGKGKECACAGFFPH